MQTLEGCSAKTDAPIEVRLADEVGEVLEQLRTELDAAVRSGLASALLTAQTGSGRRPDE